MKERILNLIYESIDELNEDLGSNGYLKKDEDSVIFGTGQIDSFAFVGFVVSIEEKIDKEVGKKVDLVSEDVLLVSSNPFRTVGTLCFYIEECFSSVTTKEGNKHVHE